MREDNREEQVQQAINTLRDFVCRLSEAAGETREYGNALFDRIRSSSGALQELAYYHDYGQFLGKYVVAGYTLTDILVWQVDHFKAWLDRPDDMNRYRRERLILQSFDTLLCMEQNPEPYVRKLCGETGTDYVDKYQ